MPSLRLYLNTWNSGGGGGELENDECLFIIYGSHPYHSQS